jgi:sugar lactone lactonase YvrE
VSIVLIACLNIFTVIPFTNAATAPNEYRFVTGWGSAGADSGQFKDPNGIAVGKDGGLYVADTWNHRIQRFESDGTFMTLWGGKGSGNGEFIAPSGIATDKDGNVYVADTGNNRIQKFDSSGTFIAKWGGFGLGEGAFQDPCGIGVDKDNNVYVCDYSSCRIQKFTSNGVFLTAWGNDGSMLDDQHSRLMPVSLAIDQAGSVYVSDGSYHRIQKFTVDGELVAGWGGYGSANGEFDSPSGIAIDGDGNVIVADFNNNRLEKLSSDGSFMAEWDGKSFGAGQFMQPSGVAIDKSGNLFVVDCGNNRIQKFSPELPEDTVAPEIGSIKPTGLLNNARPVTGAGFSDQGSGVNASSVKLLVDGVDITSLATVADSSASYTPGANLTAGTHSARIAVADNAGNIASQEWPFTVQAPKLSWTRTGVAWVDRANQILEVTYSLKNIGTGEAYNVAAHDIITTTPNVGVITPSISVGNISVGKSGVLKIRFRIKSTSVTSVNTKMQIDFEDAAGNPYSL